MLSRDKRQAGIIKLEGGGMQPQLYGNPSVGNRPSCWGKPDIYDSQDRECRGCGFQSSCRDQVIKLTPAQQNPPVTTTPAPYYHSYAPYAAPQPTVAPAPVPAPVQISQYRPAPVAPAPIAPPTYTAPATRAPVPQQPPQAAQFQQDWYGRMQDPLFFTVLSPPPLRQQMYGETFGERFFKNLLLDVGAMAAGHLMLALRQMLLPPLPPDPTQRR